MATGLISRLRRGLASLRPAEFAAAPARCPFCGPSLFVRLHAGEAGLRCVRCAASTAHLTLGAAIREQISVLAECDVCELSASGPLVAYLQKKARSFCGSEYYGDAKPGSMRNGVRCEDVQCLSYADASFDLVTHTEVLEHVPDDALAFAELRRVLRPGGTMLFTVPLSGLPYTMERARLRDGRIEHLLEPVHHVDPLHGGAGILAFRDYGTDIVDRLRRAGFDEVKIMSPAHRIPWMSAGNVVVARMCAGAVSVRDQAQR